MNHIPLYTDIVFVKLDLNHILSAATRRKFKNDLGKRRKRRQSKIQAEKHADRVILKQDQDRINERKARSQTVDPDDAFFQAAATISGPAAPSEQPDLIILDAADFGPMPGADTGTGATTTSTTSSNLESEANRINNDAGTERNSSPPSSSFSFSQAAQRGSSAANNFSAAAEAFPALSPSAAFPTLGGSSSASAPAPAPASHASGSSSSWRSESSTVAAKLAAKNAPSVDPATTVHGTPGGSKKKKKKVKNLVLFSTRGARGY